MEAIKDIYDLMKMRKPRTKQLHNMRLRLKPLPPKLWDGEWLKSRYQWHKPQISPRHNPPKSSLPFAGTQRKQSFKQNKDQAQPHQASSAGGLWDQGSQEEKMHVRSGSPALALVHSWPHSLAECDQPGRSPSPAINTQRNFDFKPLPSHRSIHKSLSCELELFWLQVMKKETSLSHWHHPLSRSPWTLLCGFFPQLPTSYANVCFRSCFLMFPLPVGLVFQLSKDLNPPLTLHVIMSDFFLFLSTYHHPEPLLLTRVLPDLTCPPWPISPLINHEKAEVLIIYLFATTFPTPSTVPGRQRALNNISIMHA